MNRNTSSRNSSIELLKIVGIFLIVISHVAQSLSTPTKIDSNPNCILNLECATASAQILIASMCRYFGTIGNLLFFIPSAWFLLDSHHVNWRKMFNLVINIWVVSVLILTVVIVIRKGDISVFGIKKIIRQFFPTVYANNWYMTAYLLFYSIHPFLNSAIKTMKQSYFLGITLGAVFLYCLLDFLKIGHFFSSILIIWIIVYLVMGYLKLYLSSVCRKNKVGLWMFIIGFLGTFGYVVLSNVLNLNIGLFNKQIGDNITTFANLLSWNSMANPFILMMVISVFMWFKNHYFSSPVINYVSGLSMLIYIIHENDLVRSYYRPMIWQKIYESYGYSHLLLWIIILSVSLFIFALISSVIYKTTLSKIVNKSGDALFRYISSFYSKMSNEILKLS